MERRLVRNPDGSIAPARAASGSCSCASLPTQPAADRDDCHEPPSRSTTTTCSRRLKAKAAPTARPRSLITGKRMGRSSGPELGRNLGGEFSKRSKDKNFDDVQKDIYGQFENTFMMYLPRLCEHCLNPPAWHRAPAARSTSARKTASC